MFSTGESKCLWCGGCEVCRWAERHRSERGHHYWWRHSGLSRDVLQDAKGEMPHVLHNLFMV